MVYLMQSPPCGSGHIVFYPQQGVFPPFLQGYSQLYHAQRQLYLVLEFVGVGADQLFGSIAGQLFPLEYPQLFPLLAVA